MPSLFEVDKKPFLDDALLHFDFFEREILGTQSALQIMLLVSEK